jgi:hypothetical protein
MSQSITPLASSDIKFDDFWACFGGATLILVLGDTGLLTNDSTLV